MSAHQNLPEQPDMPSAELPRDSIRIRIEPADFPVNTSRKRKRSADVVQDISRKLLYDIDWQPHSVPVDALTEDERLWAALAHASFLITVLAGIATGGLAGLVMVFAPLLIYVGFRDRSRFVAYHALQAFAAQLMGTIGWITLLTIGSLIFAVAITLAAIASVLLIGIPFVLLFGLLYVVFVLAMLALPLVIAMLSIAGAVSTYNGQDFRYPVIAAWIERQMGADTIL